MRAILPPGEYDPGGVDDFELLDRWRDGDGEAGSELFGRHFEALDRFLAHKVGSDEAEDLLQGVFLACVKSRDRFEKRSSFRTYLFTVARNELYQHYRKRSRRPEPVDFGADSVADLGTSPSAKLARHREQRTLLRAIRLIPIDHQMTIELFYWEGLSTAEVGEVLGIPAGTVRSRLANARKALDVAMQRVVASGAEAVDTQGDFEAWLQSMRAKRC